jgi:hypothetical protein
VARRRCGRLTTVARGCGGGPARGGAQERKCCGLEVLG